jgi:hypothetical protein
MGNRPSSPPPLEKKAKNPDTDSAFLFRTIEAIH